MSSIADTETNISGGMTAVQEHLGHSDPATTLTYVDPTQTETDKLKWLKDLRN